MASISFVILLSLLPKNALRLIQKCNYSFGYCHRKTFSLSKILHLVNSVVTFRLSCYYRRRRPLSLTFTWSKGQDSTCCQAFTFATWLRSGKIKSLCLAVSPCARFIFRTMEPSRHRRKACT